METRIKVVTREDDTKLYYPQYKGWFFWNSFKVFDYYCSYTKCCSSIKEAQIYIDEMIKYEKRLETKSITYIKYP